MSLPSKQKKINSFFLLLLLLVFFISVQSYFTYKNYLREKEDLRKTLDESLHHSVIAYKTFLINKNEIETQKLLFLSDKDTIKAPRLNKNLIWNPDFNEDFVLYSNYDKLPVGSFNVTPNSKGWYWITENPTIKFPQWMGRGFGGEGKFFLADGSLLNKNVVWNQQIKTKLNTNYCLRFWISTMAVSECNINSYWQQAFIQCKINDSIVGSILAPPKTMNWRLFQIFWNSGNDTLAKIDLNNLNTGGTYNDFGIDHIEFFETENNNELEYKATTLKINPNLDKDAIQTLLTEELRARGINLSVNLTYNPNNVALFNDVTSNSYFLNPKTVISCSFKSHHIFLISRMLPLIVLLLFSAGISVFLVLIIRKYLIKQEQINKLKYEINNNITHELKTPVSTLIAAVDMLRQFKQEKDKTEEYTDIIKKQALRLNQLIDKAMNIAVLEENEFVLKKEEVDLSQLISDTIKSERFILIKNLIINFELSGNTFKTQGDLFHLGNVLNTILENSIKYCVLNPTINIKLTEEKSNFIIAISDNGIGIPKQHHQLVFEKFYRIPDNDRHNEKGYGLGLNYAKTIMEFHKGKIRIESDGKTGTTIIIIIPK